LKRASRTAAVSFDSGANRLARGRSGERKSGVDIEKEIEIDMLKPSQVARKMNQPLVSVVMVVRNVDRFLAEAIESILGQTFTDFEFVILDFGSTDRSQAIAATYAARDNRIRLHEVPNCGLAEARNAACFLAEGQYIAIQDADDMSVPNRLLRQVEFMEKHQDFGLLGGAAEWVDSQATSLWTLTFPSEDCEIRSALATRCPFSQTAVLLRREAFVAVGGYRAAFAPSEDYDLWLRISEHFRCANLKEVVVKYRIHPQQVSVSGRKQQTFGAVAARVSAAFRKNGSSDLLNSEQAITAELLARLGVSEAELQTSLFSDYRDWIRNMVAAKEYSVALQIAAEMLQSDWEYVEQWKIAYLQLIAARLYWRQKRFPKSFVAACHAARQPAALAKDFGQALLRRIERAIRM
jgi:glycosyltransferase involved in cell wall biosynthesis